ncbi:MAG: thiL, partial [Ramlibacter sp.]|nr:thiL [Ramlibacter sp.]
LPQPRVALGLALRGIATSAIDVSDGLLGDLGHILAQSGVGARVDAVEAASLLAAAKAGFTLTTDRIEDLVLAGGDDYELAFTAPASARSAVQSASARCGTPVTRIGVIEAQAGLRVVDAAGHAIPRRFAGFDHFGA